MPEITISEENLERLEQERKVYQNTIGGGNWNIDHTLTEIFKILSNIDEEARRKVKS